MVANFNYIRCTLCEISFCICNFNQKTLLGGTEFSLIQDFPFAFYKRINKQKPQLNRVGRPKGGALMLCDDSRAQKEDKRLLFPGKGSANEKPWTLCSLYPPNFLFLSIKAFSFSCLGGPYTWLFMVADPGNCNSLQIPNKSMFAGEISGSLFIYLFFWPCRAACGVLIPQPGI